MKNMSLLSDWAQALRHLHGTDWRSSGWDMRFWSIRKLPSSPDLTCGTACCAYGLGTTLPSWKDAGIGLERVEDPPTITPRWRIPSGVWEDLGLRYEAFNYITDPYFYGDGNITPLQVAERIEEILERDGD